MDIHIIIFQNIFEYSEPDINVAFSSGKRAKRNCSVKNWVYLAEQTCIELRNPNNYNRDKLIDYFPQIRWQSMDVENGLVNVVKQLYQLGITVVFIPSFPSLHIRGATFIVNDKPCIALTDYVGFYPTLWFALVHELYHVLFDWDDLRYMNLFDHNLDDLFSSNGVIVAEVETQVVGIHQGALLFHMLTKHLPDGEEKLAVYRRVRDEIRRVFEAYARGRIDQARLRVG